MEEADDERKHTHDSLDKARAEQTALRVCKHTHDSLDKARAEQTALRVQFYKILVAV